MMTKRPRGRPAHPDLLTLAEWRVVEAVRHGLSNRQLAQRRGVSLDAVKFHVVNACQKLGLNGRDDLRHWKGVARHSALFAQPSLPNPSQTMPHSPTENDMTKLFRLGRLGQISRTVKDITAARTWYGEILGLTHLYSFGDLAFFDCDGVRLFLSQGQAEAQSILYFQVADIHAAHDELSQRGAIFVGAPHMIHRHGDGTEEWMAFFNDNEGRPLAIMAQVSI
ncbi:MAG: LuxR C-terminal-related transcriptional regulator [Asticcacaulis sp.]